MQTDELISDLAADLRPVRRLASPLVRFGRWSLAASICLSVGLTFYGFRHDLGEVRWHAGYLFEGLVLLLLALVSSLAAFMLSVPGRGSSARALQVSIALLLLWGMLAFVRLGRAVAGDLGALSPGIGIPCIRDILLIGATPGLLLFYMIRRAAPQRLGWCGLLVLLSGAGLGALAAHLSCANDAPMHIVTWHLLPVLSVGVLGIWLGRAFISADR